jgi:hypothetical protein
MSLMSFSEAVYGAPPLELAAVPDSATQVSPLIPGAARLEDAAPESLERIDILAPAGTIERRYVLAHAPQGPAARWAPDCAGPEGSWRKPACQGARRLRLRRA